MKRTWILWGLVLLFIYVARFLLVPVALGGVVATLLYPTYKRLLRKKLSPIMAGALLTLGVTVLVLLPVTLLSLIGVNNFMKILPMLQDRAQGSLDISQLPVIRGFAELMQRWFSIEFSELLRGMQQVAQASVGALAQGLGTFLASLPGVFVFMLIMIISIFFMIVDGKIVLERIRQLELVPDEDMDYLFSKSGAICRALVMATLVVALSQATLFTLGCAIAGMSNLSAIGFVVFLMSFVPLVGPTPLTFGMALYSVVTGDMTAGIILLISAGLVSTVDNFVRPMILKGEANLHPLLAFVGVFGGLQTMGFAGIFLGPILAGVFASAFKLLEKRPPEPSKVKAPSQK